MLRSKLLCQLLMCSPEGLLYQSSELFQMGAAFLSLESLCVCVCARIRTKCSKESWEKHYFCWVQRSRVKKVILLPRGIQVASSWQPVKWHGYPGALLRLSCLAMGLSFFFSSEVFQVLCEMQLHFLYIFLVWGLLISKFSRAIKHS